MTHELTNQELLDRYVHAVKMLLPADKMDDIAAEIRSNLQSLVEDKATQLGRELSPVEMSAILKQHGHPMLVAGRYRDQATRGLISPELFPFYWFTLRAILALWVTIRVIVAVFTLQGTATASSVLLTLGRDVLRAAFFIPAGVTLMFAACGIPGSSNSDTRRDGSRSLWLPFRASGNRGLQQRPMVHIAGGIVWLVFWALALFVTWVLLGLGRQGRVQSVRCRVRDAAALMAAGRVRHFSVVAELHALRHGRVAAVSAHRGGRRGNGARGLPATPRRLIGPQVPTGILPMARSLATLNQMAAGVLVLACVFAGLLCLHEVRRFFGPGNPVISSTDTR